jgi:hypothetical protein
LQGMNGVFVHCLPQPAYTCAWLHDRSPLKSDFEGREDFA